MRVLYSGHVQGVGFRYAATGVARGFAVNGWVRNLSDGRVELLAEGEAAEVEAFLKAVSDRMSGYIDKEEQLKQPFTGTSKGFEIEKTV